MDCKLYIFTNRDFIHDVLTNGNVNVKWCFVIGQCHGNGSHFDVDVDATRASNVVHLTNKTRFYNKGYDCCHCDLQPNSDQDATVFKRSSPRP